MVTMRKSTFYLIVGVFAILVVASVVSAISVSLRYQDGDSDSPGGARGGDGVDWDNCDPVEVADKCCKTVGSKDQCKNYCKQRADACGWGSDANGESELGACETDVLSNCAFA